MEKLISKAGAIASFLGLRTVLLERDHTVIEFDAGPQHANPMGTLHGGLFCDLSDYAMGTAWVTGLSEGESCTTIELKINFLSPSGLASSSRKRAWCGAGATWGSLSATCAMRTANCWRGHPARA